MNDQQLNTLTQRLDRLERENRWWRTVGIVSVAVLGIIVLMGAMGSKDAETKKLLEELKELTDDSRVTLLINEQGSPTLTLTDGNGASAVLGHTTLETKRTGVTTKRPSSSLVLFNKDGKVIWSAP